MQPTVLRQVLTIFETADKPLSLPQIAHQLNISLEQLEGMIQHWVRKGKLRESGAVTECGSCGRNGDCPFVMELPRSFELIAHPYTIPLAGVPVSCAHKPPPP